MMAPAPAPSLPPTTTTARATPTWLTRTEVGLCPCGCVGRRRRTSYLDATVQGVARRTREMLTADDLAARPGFLAGVDPRAKITAAAIAVVGASLLHHVLGLVVVSVAAFAVAWAGGVPAGRYLRRVWLTVPLFTAFVALPATLNLITPGETLVSLGTWFGHPVSVTAPGVVTATRLVARTAASLSIVLLVTMTTPWHRLLAALGSLRLPPIFVAVLAMAWRYVLLLSGTVTDLYQSRRARGAGAARGRAESRRGRAMVSATAGTVHAKAHHLSEEVYDAMVARGYTGVSRVLGPQRLSVSDLVAVALMAAATVVLVAHDRGLPPFSG
jgi:cobalt/nickel transport system permease protein